MLSSPARRVLGLTARGWFVVALGLLMAGLSVQYSVKVLSHPNRSAFNRWQGQLLDLDNDVDIAEKYNYPNPPVMALVLYPLAKLPPLAGALAWFYVKAALTVIAFFWIFQLVETPERPFPLWAKALTVVLSLRPIIGDLHHGNVNLFILFLVVAALAAFRRRRDFAAGLLLGLAVACKVTPALFLPYFLWKRQWKVLAGAAAGLVLFLWPGFVPAMFLGWDDNQRQVASWYEKMVVPYVVEGKVTSEHNNQSLPGLAARLLTHSPAFSTYVKDANNNEVYTPTGYGNVVDIGPDAAKWLVRGCMGLFALATVWTCRAPDSTRCGWRWAAEFSLILLGMLLFSERTWKHHCVTLALPFAVLCYYLAACRPAARLRWGVAGALAAAALLMALTMSGFSDEAGRPGDVADMFSKQAQVYGVYVIAYVVLAAALVVLLRRRPEALSAQEAPPRPLRRAG
jgi:hypothetical protein